MSVAWDWVTYSATKCSQEGHLLERDLLFSVLLLEAFSPSQEAASGSAQHVALAAAALEATCLVAFEHVLAVGDVVSLALLQDGDVAEGCCELLRTSLHILKPCFCQKADDSLGMAGYITILSARRPYSMTLGVSTAFL